MEYLLDTDTVSNLVRYPVGVVAARLRALGREDVCTSIIVAAELRFGAARKADRALVAKVETVLERLPVMPFEPPADRAFAEMRAILEKRGMPVGAYDLLIAAHALVLGCVMVTGNERGFSRIEGLRVENWLTSSPR
jgi:tRNA(fMet)-specific endonuclease VapC